MEAFFSRIKKLFLLQGWRRGTLACLLGLLAGLAFVPFNLVPVLWISFPGLFFLLKESKSKKDAFILGWSFAFGFLVVGLHWIAAALFVELDAFWWVLPLAVGGLPALLALYYGAAAMLAHLWGMKRLDGVLAFALCWMGAEAARAHLLTGLPWDLVGYVWADFLPVLQSVSLFGIEGLTLVTLLLALLPSFFFFPQERKRARILASIGALLFASLVVWGQMRLSDAPHETVENVRLRLIQPNLDQEMKWQPEKRLANFQHLLNISFGQADEKNITHFIWPETATAYYLTEEKGVRARIADRMPEKSILLTGVVRRQQYEGQPLRYYNSLIALNGRGDVIAGYDKKHLVPFGEYFPFRSLFPFRVVTALGIDFTSGDRIKSLRVPSLPSFGPLICYEAIFSGAVLDPDDPPAFLLNLTNDGWYEGTIGPAQHFAMVRARAIEEGLPLVRVANKGVTGVVDPWGRLVAKIESHTRVFVDTDLPKPIRHKTFFQKQRTKVSWLMVVLLSLITIILRFVKVNVPKK